MRNLFLALFIHLLFLGTTAFAHDVLVVQSLGVKPFDEALRGFKNVCKSDLKKVVISEEERVDILKTVREEKPQLILAIGADALRRVKVVRNIPIIYMMVRNPQKILGGGYNVTGVSMNIPPGKYLGLIRKLNLPKTKVGILYDPAKTGDMMKKIQQTARAMGAEITTKEVHSPKAVPEMLTKMNDSFTVFWMLPDPTVVTPETVEFLLLFTQQNRIPVVTFAGKYVEMGALIALDIDSFDIGKQAGEMANKVLNGTDVSDIPIADARKAVIKVNRKVAKKLGVDLDDIETFDANNPD